MKELVVLIFILSFLVLLLGVGLLAILCALIPNLYEFPLGKLINTIISISGGVCILTAIPATIFLNQNNRAKSD